MVTWPTPRKLSVLQTPITRTDWFAAGKIAALLALAARLYDTNAAFGVVIVWVACTTTLPVSPAIRTTIEQAFSPQDPWGV
jgi:hypothetical protein